MITLNGISNDGSSDTVTTMNLCTHFTLKDGKYTLSANSSSSKIGVRLYGHDADGNTNALRTVYGNNSIVYDTTNDGYNEYILRCFINESPVDVYPRIYDTLEEAKDGAEEYYLNTMIELI